MKKAIRLSQGSTRRVSMSGIPTHSSSLGFIEPSAPMPRGVYRSDPASMAGSELTGTSLPFARPVTSTQAPRANSTPSAASFLASFS